MKNLKKIKLLPSEKKSGTGSEHVHQWCGQGLSLEDSFLAQTGNNHFGPETILVRGRPLAFGGVVYSSTRGQKALTFGVSGMVPYQTVRVVDLNRS